MSLRRLCASILFIAALFILVTSSFAMIVESNERVIQSGEPPASQEPAPFSIADQADRAGIMKQSDRPHTAVLPAPSPLVDIRDASTSADKRPSVQYSEGPWISFNFDDGFESSYLHALPIMDAAGFKTTQYIVTGSIGYKNYISLAQLQKIYSAGHEIGAHTRTHPRLDTLPLEQAQSEIVGSKEDLLKLGITPVTFAYPHGSHSPAIVDMVRKAGFMGARITRPGFNDTSTDPYLLWYYGINASTTLPVLQEVIDQAVINKKWLIFVLHRVDGQSSDYENVSPKLIQQLVDYVKQQNIRVVTNAEGLQMLEQVR